MVGRGQWLAGMFHSSPGKGGSTRLYTQESYSHLYACYMSLKKLKH